jgi:hypothetical protein
MEKYKFIRVIYTRNQLNHSKGLAGSAGENPRAIKKGPTLCSILEN